MKKCKTCNQEKPLTEFYKSSNYYKAYCKECFNNKMKEYYTKYKGIYGIFSDNICLYIGQSKRLKERMSKHKTLLNNLNLIKHMPAHISLYKKLSQHKNLSFKMLAYEDNKQRRLELEAQYITKYKPKYNEKGTK